MAKRQRSVNTLEPDSLGSNPDSTIYTSATLGKLPNLGMSAFTSIR